MPSNDPTVTLMLIEASAFLSIALALIVSFYLMNKRKQSKRIASMLKHINDRKDERKNHLVSAFSGIPGIKAGTLENIANEISTNEISFCQLISNAFIDNKSHAIENLDDELIKHFSVYELLSPEKHGLDANNSGTIIESDNISFDDAIDNILSANDEASSHNNPEFDLSHIENEHENNANDSGNSLGIAEIPEELLTGNNDEHRHQ